MEGAGVALLAIWAAIQARDVDGWLIAAVMALGATGDVLLDAQGLETGGGVRDRPCCRGGAVSAQPAREPDVVAAVVGGALVPLSVVIVWGLTRGARRR